MHGQMSEVARRPASAARRSTASSRVWDRPEAGRDNTASHPLAGREGALGFLPRCRHRPDRRVEPIEGAEETSVPEASIQSCLDTICSSRSRMRASRFPCPNIHAHFRAEARPTRTRVAAPQALATTSPRPATHCRTLSRRPSSKRARAPRPQHHAIRNPGPAGKGVARKVTGDLPVAKSFSISQWRRDAA